MDSSYAPSSPDLSNFLNAPNNHQPQQQQATNTTSTSYAPRSPSIPPPPYDLNSTNNNTSFGPFQQPLPNYQYTGNLNQQSQFLTGASPTGTGFNDFTQFGAGGNQYMPHSHSHSFSTGIGTGIAPSPTISAPQFYLSQPDLQSPYFNNSPRINTSPIKESPSQTYNRIPSPIKQNPLQYQYTHPEQNQTQQQTSTMTTRQPRQPRVKQPLPPNNLSTHPSYEQTMALAPLPPSAPTKNPNPDNIEIKTKFPVARIKRIMQADEEVGKVAQVTPVAVSKALELFMISLVQGAAKVAREKGGKRVTAQCLKRVVEGDEQFDFLGEIVGRVQDGPGEGEKGTGEGGVGVSVGVGVGVEGKGKGRKRKEVVEKEKAEGSDTEEEEPAEKKVIKRKGKGGRRKKIEE